MQLAVYIQPRASRNALVGWHGEELKIAVTSPPVDGAANGHVIELLAKSLRLPKSQLRVVRGETSRHKLLEIPLEESELKERIAALLAGR